MQHADRASAPPQDSSSAGRLPWMKTGAPALGGGSVETLSEVPEAAQLENYHRYLRGRDAEQQDFDTSMAESRAREARSSVLAESPFYGEELQAKSKIGEEAIKAQLDVANRGQILKITSDAAAQMNKLHSDPRFMKLSMQERKRMEDQVWDQARLAISGLTKTNLYPHPDPYAFLNMAPGGTPPPPQEK
jgi:hypothetical protein